ncbi:hypothetical protein NMG60_11017068 [Bertholletia excelsa]
MASDLFQKQGKIYRKSRPNYPEELYQFIASKTPFHHLAWDVGTGSGQAAVALAGIFKNVVATDTSQGQLDFAPKLPNVRYQRTPPNMSAAELEQQVSDQGGVDLVTVAQAMHWFDLPSFHREGATTPEISDKVDSIFNRVYFMDSRSYWSSGRNLIVDRYRSIDFPFEPADGCDHMGPFEFKAERLMDLEDYLAYTRSGSAYRTARDKGVELLTDDVVEEFKQAWGDGGNCQKIIKFPVYLRIGKVGNLN